MLYAILVVLCCLCAIWKLWCRKDSTSEPPILSGWLPIMGHAHLLIRHDLYKLNVSSFKELLDNGVSIFYIGFKKLYVVTDPEAIMTICNTCLEKSDILSSLKPFLGEGLVTVGSVSTWKKHRKLLNPAFSYSKLKSAVTIFNRQARRLTQRLDQQLGKPVVYEDVLKLNNLETISLTATGMSSDECTLREKYLPLVRKMLDIFNNRIRQPLFRSDIIFNLSSLKREQDKTTKQLWDFSYSIIEKKRKEMKTTKKLEDNNSETHKSFLELMLETANNTTSFTDDQIISEINTIIVTGFETIAINVNVTLIMLGSHQDVQEKVYNEIIHLNGGSDKDLDTDDLSKLVYTEAVIKETLRLYPPVPGTGRHNENNIRLKNYIIPAKSTCILNLYGLNRHPVWGPDADQFRPERWLDTSTLPDMNCFGSFALGRRNCIGKTYAMLSMKVILAHAIRRYRVSADISKVEFKWRLICGPASGNQYTIERREK